MKKLGIIAGMSPETTIHYHNWINEQVNKKCGGLNFAEMIIYSVNFEEYRKLMLEGNWFEIGIRLGNIASLLEQAGADCVVIATNTMHKVANYVATQITVPLIHIADCVAFDCKERGVKKVGLLGTRYTMVESFLRDRLKENGLEVFVPDSEKQINEIDMIIFDELCKGEVNDYSRDYYIGVINAMIDKYGIEGIILGCTEIDMLIKQEDVSIPVFDTTQSHINYLVKFCLEE